MSIPLTAADRAAAQLVPTDNGWERKEPDVQPTQENDAVVVALQEALTSNQEQYDSLAARVQAIENDSSSVTALASVQNTVTDLSLAVGTFDGRLTNATGALASEYGALSAKIDSTLTDRPLLKAVFLFDTIENLNNASLHSSNTYAFVIDNDLVLESNGTSSWSATALNLITVTGNNSVEVQGNVSLAVGTSYLASLGGKNIVYEELSDGGITDRALVSASGYLKINDGTSYSVFNIAAAEASYVARDINTNAVLSILTPGENCYIDVLLEDTDGNYAATSGDPDVIHMDVDIGAESFIERLAGTNINRYRYTPPSSNQTLRNVTFTVGKRDPSGNELIAEFTIQLDVKISTSYANVVDLSGSLISQGNWSTPNWEGIMGLDSAFEPTNKEHLSLIDDAGVRKIRQQHVAASNGSDRVLAPFDIPPRDYIKVKQTMKVAPNFTWGTNNYSGKLGFGFGGGANTSGGNSNPAGFTLRPAWHDDGEFSLYSYAADRDNGGNADFGELIGSGFFITPGVEFDIEVEAQINSSFSAKDGWAKLYINGSLELELTGIGWQTQAFEGESSPHFDRVTWSQFHGGADANWAPVETTFVENWNASWE